MSLHTQSHDDLLSSEDTSRFSRAEQAAAGCAAFFDIAKEWGLSNEEAQVLLGNPSRSRFYEIRRGSGGALRSLSDDEMDRLAYLTGIYAALNVLYTADSHGEWLRNSSRAPAEALYRPWGTGSPLGYMLTGKLKALSDVYEYVNAERGGM